MGRHSGVDVLVIVPDGMLLRATAQELHVRMVGVCVPVDIVVATPTVLARYGNSRGLIYRAALRHGREVYAAKSARRTLRQIAVPAPLHGEPRRQ